MTPRITPDDRIIMDLEVKKDSVGQIVLQHLRRSTPRGSTTQVLVDNGDTIVLGGIFEQTTRTTVDQGAVPRRHPVPRLPLQATRSKQDDKTELLIFVTPKIVKDTLTIR